MLSDELPTSGKYYWETVTNVCSSLLDLFISRPGTVALGQIVPLVVSKLPVKGDYREAEFIYETLLLIAQKFPREIIHAIPALFAGVVRTLAMGEAKFAKYELQEQTVVALVSFVKTILSAQPQMQMQIPAVLSNDEAKVKKLIERINKVSQ